MPRHDKIVQSQIKNSKEQNCSETLQLKSFCYIESRSEL